MSAWSIPFTHATLDVQKTYLCPDCGNKIVAFPGEEVTCRSCGRVFVAGPEFEFCSRETGRTCKICGRPIKPPRRKYCQACANLIRYNQKLRLQRERSRKWLSDWVKGPDGKIHIREYLLLKKEIDRLKRRN
ncbi:MAG TPA: hypothetical protein ENF30_01840 [Candidatus Desulfofervidus auxilii]|uniref:DZANK-type domain-containing protein n=1 Tax=Desulfofervidus auxilii TaxID=1621989 RepID=A0A7V0NER2_DESA2|nr:hypothetical protein [Candidatus Desulfofervidus auxilii]